VALRVLIVDDSSTMRAYVRACLEDDGDLDCEVAEADSGFEALRVLPRERFDLVIVDINMPNINGLELVAMLRKSEAHGQTPVVIISTESSPRDRERGLELGANEYLAKPFEPEALRAAVARLCPSEPG
jgi:two-component system chemotaxis response regulator CheY